MRPHPNQLGESCFHISTSWESPVSTSRPAGDYCVHSLTSWERSVSTFRSARGVVCPHIDQMGESCVHISTSGGSVCPHLDQLGESTSRPAGGVHISTSWGFHISTSWGLGESYVHISTSCSLPPGVPAELPPKSPGGEVLGRGRRQVLRHRVQRQAGGMCRNRIPVSSS